MHNTLILASFIFPERLDIYTINALNKIIERDFNLSPGNINHKSYSIDWDNYQNSMILIIGGELKEYEIKRIS